MFDHKRYVPILKWRMGEYQALSKLSTAVKAWVTPLIEIPKETWDFELGAPSKSLDDHLKLFGTRLFQKWGGAQCYVDSCYIPNNTFLTNGMHHLTHIFQLARIAGAMPIPVTGLGRSPSYQASVSSILATDRRGVCIRLLGNDFAQPLLPQLHALLSKLGVGPEQVDMVIDVSTDVLKNPFAQASAWNALLNTVPFLTEYRTLSLAGSSIPSTFSTSSLSANSYIERSEWKAYRELSKLQPARLPAFGDYGVLHPVMVEMDPRFIDPNAKIKYCTKDAWYIAIGKQVRKHGRAQYQALCDEIIQEKPVIFGGPTFCHGDHFIHQCANGGSTGGTSTWPTVTTNRHITVTVRSIATEFGHAAPI